MAHHSEHRWKRSVTIILIEKRHPFRLSPQKQLKFSMRQSKIATYSYSTIKKTTHINAHCKTSQIHTHTRTFTVQRTQFRAIGVFFFFFWSSTSCERRKSDLNIRLLGWTDKYPQHPSSMTRRLNCKSVSEKQGHITRKAPFLSFDSGWQSIFSALR